MAPKQDLLENYTIPDIEKVVQPYLDGRKIAKVDISRLTAPGENYLSLVFRVDLDVVDNEGKTETISAVAKRLPVGQSQKPGIDFNGSAMRNEIKWYVEVVPILKNFAKQNGIEADYFPVYLGSRLSLNPESQVADSEAVLLVKNLHPEGFSNENRLVGFDLKTAKSILKTLAAFHATVLGMKFKKPEQFSVIKSYLETNAPKPPPPNAARPEGPPPGPPFHLIIEKAIELPACQPYIAHLQRLKENMLPAQERFNSSGKEPWITVMHADFWGNNIMVTKPQDGKPVAVKILDFQLCLYSSYARDLTFFLLTSLSDDVMKNHFEELLRLYYDELTSILNKIELVELQLSYSDYEDELKKTVSKHEVYHALFFCCPIFASRNNVADHLTGEVDFMDHINNMLNNMGPRQEERLALVLETCVNRGWI